MMWMTSFIFLFSVMVFAKPDRLDLQAYQKTTCYKKYQMKSKNKNIDFKKSYKKWVDNGRSKYFKPKDKNFQGQILEAANHISFGLKTLPNKYLREITEFANKRLDEEEFVTTESTREFIRTGFEQEKFCHWFYMNGIKGVGRYVRRMARQKYRDSLEQKKSTRLPASH